MSKVLELIETNCPDCAVGVVADELSVIRSAVPDWLLILLGSAAVGSIGYMAVNWNKKRGKY
jgi:hypothetical protein